MVKRPDVGSSVYRLDREVPGRFPAGSVSAYDLNQAGVVLEADFDAQTILAATTDDTPTARTIAEQEVVGRLTGGNIAGITIGIADNNMVQVDGTPVDTEVAVWTAAGLDSKSEAEFKALVNLEIGTDVLAQQTI